MTNRFNRDFALVTEHGRILAESHNPERLEQFRAEVAEEGIKAVVVPSDLPRSRAS